MRIVPLLARIGLVLLVPAGAARADEAACQKIVAAMRAMGKAKAVHMTMTRVVPGATAPGVVEQILMPDATYLKSPSGHWVKAPMAAAQRAALAERVLQEHPLEDCKRERRETVAGVALQVYRFQQTLPVAARGTGEAPRTEAGTRRFWIGEKDGLPRRLDSESPSLLMTALYRYENVSAPPDAVTGQYQPPPAAEPQR